MKERTEGSSITKSDSYCKKETRYEDVKKEISTTWPEWKKNAYNNYFATSAHAKKA